ncbi:type IX secretion system outer membrane channel protein PorV [Prolixibacteraceae bacterium JC049]|nr:type IX secretion system outer membrane channel protein PorV [Prolixibacteraceae bacterium JC049]
MIKFYQILTVVLIFASWSLKTHAQSSVTGANVVTTAVPFLNITPDSRAGGMGDAGVATLPDVNSQHWNPAKFAFMDSETSASLSYTPWLRKLVSDMSVSYLTGYKKLDDVQTISGSLRYFALGDINFIQNADDQPLVVSPSEFALDFAYTRLLSDNLSGSVAIRYIRSDIFGGQEVDGNPTKAGNSFAADVAFYYHKTFKVNRRHNIFTAGLNISNIGSKIAYDDENKHFIPTNLRLGIGYSIEMDRYNRVSFTTEANKLMVPIGVKKVPGDNGSVVIADPEVNNKSVISGMISSFSDAPGGFSEELKEINLSFGAEYTYNEQFSVRAGYFYENPDKGNRKFITAGAGLKMNLFALDFSYLVPTTSNHPLENTLRFTLSFDFDQMNPKKKRSSKKRRRRR